MIKDLDIFGLKVSDFKLPDIDTLYHEIIASQNNIVVFGYSLGYITLFKKHPGLYPIINDFDLLVCDGTQFNWFCRLFGYKLTTILSIPDITNYTLEYANSHHLSVLLLGAKTHINELATKNLRKKYPNAKFLDGIDGYFKREDEISVVRRINGESPDILLIGISTPKKENFAFEYRNKLKTKIIIPCGGMIDVYSGLTKQTPSFIKKIGLATPYRIVQEPRRLFFLHSWMIIQIFFRIIPIALYQRFILGKKNFNLVTEYTKK